MVLQEQMLGWTGLPTESSRLEGQSLERTVLQRSTRRLVMSRLPELRGWSRQLGQTRKLLQRRKIQPEQRLGIRKALVRRPGSR